MELPEIRRLVREKYGVDLTTQQAEDLKGGSDLSVQKTGTDWISEMNQDQRAQILALMSGQVYSGGVDRSGGFWGAAGNLVGQGAIAFLGGR